MPGKPTGSRNDPETEKIIDPSCPWCPWWLNFYQSDNIEIATSLQKARNAPRIDNQKGFVSFESLVLIFTSIAARALG